MNKVKVIAVALAVVAVLAVLRFMPGPKAGSGDGSFVLEPVKFVYKADGPPGAAATVHGKTVSEQDLQDRSPALFDLTLQEIKMLAEAAVKLSAGKTKAGVELFAADRNGALKAALDKLKLPLNVTLSPKPPAGRVALLDGNPLTREQLNLNQVQYSLIKTRQFREKLAVLREIAVRQLLFESAKAQGLDLEKFIKEKVMKDATVTETEVAEFAAKNGIALGKNDDETRNRLHQAVYELKQKTAIDEYARRNYDEKAEIHFSPPSYVFPVNENKMIVSQDNPGATTVLVFSNLECSACVGLARDLIALKKKHRKDIRVGFVSFFGAGDYRSPLLAEASHCVNSQKHEYFWKFFESVAALPKPPDETAINEAVKSSGAEYDAFRGCLQNRRYKDEVAGQLKYASDFGVLIQPTVIVGSQVIAGSVRAADLELAGIGN